MIQAALDAADPATAVSQYLQRQKNKLHVADQQIDLDEGRLFLVSVGKAAVPIAQAALAVVGDRLTQGIVIAKHLPADTEPAGDVDSTRVTWFEGNHPIAGEKSIQATTAVLEMLQQTEEGDLLLCLISGGTSALLTQPVLNLSQWQALNDALLGSGCTIQEFNTVRRQLDRVKGGGLAQTAAPARVISLILSDVIGNDLAAIGSGPTVPRQEDPQAALQVLKQYNLGQQLPVHLWEQISRALAAAKDRKPRQDAKAQVTNLIIGDVDRAARAAAEQANALGFAADIVTTHLEGEARQAGQFVAAIAKDLPLGKVAILGGETTVTLRGDGIGGRNLEVALAAAQALDGWPAHLAIATLATDGDDGLTDAAGALISGKTAAYGRQQNLSIQSYLDNNDSYTYFQKLDEAGVGPHLIKTGPTGTNVNDLIFILNFEE